MNRDNTRIAPSMPRKSAASPTAQDGLPSRLRAARAFADLSREQLVKRLADSDLTVRKIARFEQGLAQPSVEQVAAVAAACRLPAAFFTTDFEALNDPLAALSARVDEVTAQLRLLKALVVESAQNSRSRSAGTIDAAARRERHAPDRSS